MNNLPFYKVGSDKSNYAKTSSPGYEARIMNPGTIAN